MSIHPLITVIVPVYNDWARLWHLIACLERQTLPREQWQVLVVDNGSAQLPEVARLPAFATFLSCTKPGSYAARNRAIAEAKGCLLVFTDADCLPVDGWLEEHAKAFRQNGDNVINAGGVALVKQEPTAPNLYEQYDMLLGIRQEHWVKKRRFGVTANLAVPAAVFQKTGVFDATRFSGGDAEFCRRAVSLGVGLQYWGEALVQHPPRSGWQVLLTKTRRMKGAQVRHGKLVSRLSYALRAFLPPVGALRLIIGSGLGGSTKRGLVGLAFRLRLAEALEVLRWLAGAKAERR